MDWSGKLTFLLVAAIAGGLMAVQGTLNGMAAKIIGLIESTFTVHVLGAITAGVCLLLWSNGNWAKIGEAPWYVWLGGPIGVAIIVGVAFSIPRLGVGTATTAIIAAQLATAYLIDHFGWLGMQSIPFTWMKAGGIALIVVGAKVLLD